MEPKRVARIVFRVKQGLWKCRVSAMARTLE